MRSAGTPYTLNSSSRAFSAITTTLAEMVTIWSNTRRCAGLGAARTVCSVVTIGMVSRESRVMMWLPASPPKMPNSCCSETSSNLPAFSTSAACP